MWRLRWILAAAIGFAVHDAKDASKPPEELASCQENDYSLLQLLSQRAMLADISLITPWQQQQEQQQMRQHLQPCKVHPTRGDLPPVMLNDLNNIRKGELNIRNAFLTISLCIMVISAAVTKMSVPDRLSQRKKETLPHAKPMCAESLQPLREKLLCDLIQGHDSKLIIAVDGRQSLSYGQLRDFLNSDRSDVSRYGVTEGDRLALLLGSGPEAAVVLFALTAQCAVMPLDPRLPEQELAFSLQDLPAKAVVTTQEHAYKVLTHQVLLLRPDHVIAGLYSLEANFSAVQASRPSHDSVAVLLHTSGTTKKPKLVPLSHSNLLLGAHCTRETLELSSNDRCLNMLPLYHVGGISCNILGTAAAKASVVCGPHFSAVDALQWMQRHQPSWYYATPTMHQLLMGQLEQEQSLHRLNFIRNASAALLPSVAARMQETFGCLVLPTYGMTECVPICSHRRGGLVQIASVGPPCNPEVCISNEGEILIRGPGVTSGYEMRPHWEEDPNLQAFAGGWFRTGDMGAEAPDGYFFISGRSKEIINRGGEKISPFQVEEAMRDPRVAEMVAFSLPHDELGEEVAIAVKLSMKLSEGAEPDMSLFALLESLREVANGTLAEKWLPQVLVLVDEIPRTRAGKTARVGLASRFGLPRGSLSSAGYRIYVWRKGSLMALQSQPTEQAASTMDSLGISLRGKGALSPELRQLVMAMYTVAIYLVVVHHQVSIFGDTSTLSFMPPWAIAFVETLTRTIGTRWRLVLIVICSGYVNAAEALNRWRVLVFMIMYFALLWPIKPAAEWLSSTITGLPGGACHTNVGHRYFLPVILISQVLLEIGRRFPHPGLQCIGTFLAAIMIRNLPIRWQQIWAVLPEPIGSWIEPPWAGTDTCVLYVALYLAVGYFGMPIASVYTANPRFKSQAARISASLVAFCVLLSLFAAQSWNTVLFFQHYQHVYDRLEPKPPWYELPSQKSMNDLIRLKITPLTTVGWCLDAVFSVMLFPLLAVAIAPMAPWLSQFGRYAWGVFCAQGLLFYCNCGPPGWTSFGIMVRGVVLLPSLQSMIAWTSGYGVLQLLLIFLYAICSILVVCVPFQACYLFLVQGLQTVWKTRIARLV